MIRLFLCAIVLGGFASQTAAGPLHNAARDGDVEQVKSLITSGEDVNKRNRNLGWPLHQAALNDYTEIAELLIAAGADVNVEHRIFGSPLLAAAQKGSVGVAALLLESGANTDFRTANGSTPLHIAASGGYPVIVELLVASGADVNARTARPNAERGDYAPIHSAGVNGHFDVVALLRSLGATSPLVEPIASLLTTAVAEAGRAAFGERGDASRCRGCHSVSGGDTEPLRGPNLQGVVGRDKASAEDYEYSEALVRLGGVWTVAELNAFIAGPLDYAPGAKMEFWGVADPAERANIITYLQTASE
jgi:cytochrome c2